MKLINKIIFLFLFSISSIIANEKINTKQVSGTEVALVNFFWSEFSKNRDEIFIDDYLFSISEDENFYIIKCDLDIEQLKKRYKNAHPNANMNYFSIKGGCGWSKISKDNQKIIEKKYYK